MEQPQVIFLNGASSSGKTTIATILQDALPGIWMRVAVDDVCDALPRRLKFEDKRVKSEHYRLAAIAFYRCVAAIASTGANVIADGVFSRRRLEETKEALTDIPTAIIGVMCPVGELDRREAARQDRENGLARGQHGGVDLPDLYDLTVDTSLMTPEESAKLIMSTFGFSEDA